MKHAQNKFSSFLQGFEINKSSFGQNTQPKLKMKKTWCQEKEDQIVSLGTSLDIFFKKTVFESTLRQLIQYDKDDEVELPD